MISNLLIPYLGNKKIFSFEKAVIELNDAGNSDAFDIVLGRHDFDPDVFYGSLSHGILTTIIENCSNESRDLMSKYDIKILVKYAKKIDYWRWWEFVFARVREIENDDIPDFLNSLDANNTIFVDMDAVTCCITNIKDSKEAISILHKTKATIFKKLFFLNEGIKDYVEKIATNDELIEIGLSVDDEEVWNRFLERVGFRSYLTKTMPFSLAIKVAEKSKVESIQSLIISRTDFTNKLLEDYANFADRTNFQDRKVAWKVLFQTEFYPADKSLKLSSLKKHQINGIPSLVLKRASVIRYLNALNAENSIKLLKECKCVEISKFVLSRKDIKFEVEKLFDMLCIHDNNHELWTIVFEREEIKYLDTFFDDELIALAKKYDLILLWKFVISKVAIDKAMNVVIDKNEPMITRSLLKREDLSGTPEELVSFAHKAKSHDVWKKILGMPEVRAYIES